MSANSFANCVHLILNDTTGHTSSASTSYFMRLQWGRIESFFSPPLHIYLHIISSHQRRQWALHGHPWLKKRKKPRVRESKKRGNRCQKENNMQEEEAGWIRVSETESTSIKIWCALASSEEASLWQLCPNSTPFPVGYNSSIFDSSHESLLEKKTLSCAQLIWLFVYLLYLLLFVTCCPHWTSSALKPISTSFSLSLGRWESWRERTT